MWQRQSNIRSFILYLVSKKDSTLPFSLLLSYKSSNSEEYMQNIFNKLKNY